MKINSFIKSLFLLVLFVFVSQGCKNSSLVPETIDESKLIAEYLTTHGFKENKNVQIHNNSSNRIANSNHVMRLSEVKKIIEQFEELSKFDRIIDIKSKFNLKNGRVQMPVCSTAGNYHIQDVATGGAASWWVIDYSITSSRTFDNVNIYIEGVPIGWIWSQQAVYQNGFAGFCVTGTVTMGLQLGSLPTSYTAMYNLRVTLLDDCKASIRQTFGHC